MAPVSNVLTMMTLNCHGFNQAKMFLNDMCNNEDNLNSPDCIFLQELWLTPDNIHKIDKLSDRYMFYGVSAMEHRISSSILIGRPYGGVGVLIKNNLAKLVRFSESCERFVYVVIGSTIFLNVYLPNIKVEADKEILTELLVCIEDVLVRFSSCKLILGGDLNLNLINGNNSEWSTNLFKEFMQRYDLLLCDNFLSNPDSLQFTFSNETTGRFSLIDYFVVSRSLFDSVQDCVIYDNPINMSDHNPVMLSISDCFDLSTNVNNLDEIKMSDIPKSQNVLRWDHSNLRLYYDYTHELIRPLWSNMKAFSDMPVHLVNDSSSDLIDQFYYTLITNLNSAADKSIVRKKTNFFKYWWDAEGDILKENSIQTYRHWKDNGRPRSGDIYIAKTKAKFEYKSYIANKQKMEHNEISNSLHEALSNKNNNNFWSIWNSKFGSKKSCSNVINGSSNNQTIADNFAIYFSKIYTEEQSLTDNFSSVFDGRFLEYVGNDKELLFDIATIDDVISKLKRGKASGVDNISCEHLQFAHPIVYSCITLLFNLMVSFKHVPAAFGEGIIIPIPKGDKNRKHDKLEDFRGITISCTISKNFETSLMRYLRNYFLTSERQFGFKSKVGCSDAIYSLRKTVEHFTNRGSTVNICSMDLSKAFDKVNFKMLFCKLMDRKIPRIFIELLDSWYSKLFSSVRWNGELSNYFKITSGVRQGGILSPILFAICVDDLLAKLEKSKMGCFLGFFCCNSFMYADDLILISITVRDLQSLVNLCSSEINKIGLSVNCGKTFCLRIGLRHGVLPSCIYINTNKLKWVNDICYLGVSVVSSKSFKINLQNRKQKFFRSLNAIFGKTGGSASPAVVISLVESYCVSVLLYGSDCLNMNKSMLQSLENAYSQLYSKLFHTFNKNIIKQCMFYFGQLPIELKIANRRFNFLKKISLRGNKYCRYFDPVNNELCLLFNKYCGLIDSNEDNSMSANQTDFKYLLIGYFERSLE